MDRQEWVRRFYADGTDKLDPAVMADGLSEDVRFVAFGAETVGRDAAAATTEQLRAAGITAMRHDIETIWQPEPSVVLVQASVTYEVADHPIPPIPAATVFRWRGDEVSEVRVYLDSAPLLAALTAQASSRS